MKVKTNVRAGQGGSNSVDTSTTSQNGVNAGGVNSGGVNGGGGGGGGKTTNTVVYYAPAISRCVGI
jgi:hypothetical protein